MKLANRGSCHDAVTLVTLINDSNITVVKVLCLDDGPIQVHKTRACLCPEQLPPRFYWYGGNRKSIGKVPWRMKRRLFQDNDHPRYSTTDHPRYSTTEATHDGLDE